MIKLTGLWKNQGKNGEYFAGTLGGAKIVILPNAFKNSDKQPDYNLFLDEAKKKTGEGTGVPQESEGFVALQDDDELPF